MRSPFTDPDPVAETIAHILEAQDDPTVVTEALVLTPTSNHRTFRTAERTVKSLVDNAMPEDALAFANICLAAARRSPRTPEAVRAKIGDFMSRIDKLVDLLP